MCLFELCVNLNVNPIKSLKIGKILTIFKIIEKLAKISKNVLYYKYFKYRIMISIFFMNCCNFWNKHFFNLEYEIIFFNNNGTYKSHKNSF